MTTTKGFTGLTWNGKFKKTITYLKTNPWNGDMLLGLFPEHTKIKQTQECLFCADEPAAIDNGILAVLNAWQYST